MRWGSSRCGDRKEWNTWAGQISKRAREQPMRNSTLVYFESQSYCAGNNADVRLITLALRGKTDSRLRVDLGFRALCRCGGRAYHSGCAAPLAATATALQNAASTAPHSNELRSTTRHTKRESLDGGRRSERLAWRRRTWREHTAAWNTEQLAMSTAG